MKNRALGICLVTSTFPPLVGGAETYAFTFADGMKARGHDVTVVTDGLNHSSLLTDPVRLTEAELPFPVVRLTEYRLLFDREGAIPWEILAFGLLPELERSLAPAQFDVVVTNSLDAAWIGKMLSMAKVIPWVATFHEQAPEVEPFGRARLDLVYRVLCPDLVLAGSDMYAERAIAYGRGDVTVRVAHGVDTERFAPHNDPLVARRRWGIEPEAIVLLCAARLTPRKGIPDLIHAAAELKDRWPTLRVVIAGTVNSSHRAYAGYLRTEVRAVGLETEVLFDESAGPDDMPLLFAAADIIVQPSHAEGLGLAVLEGMSSARAVVTTDIPATRQIAKGRDVLIMIKPGDVEALSRALEGLVADVCRRSALAAAGRRHVVRWFSRDRMIQETEKALFDLVTRPRWIKP